MSNASRTNIPNLLIMVRPTGFGFNNETAASNFFQGDKSAENVSEIARKEFDTLVRTLESEGVAVRVFEDVRQDLPDSVFPNNWIAHTPDGRVILFPMLTENRRREVREDIVLSIFAETEARQLIDLRVWATENKFLEGTGSIVFDHPNRIAYACESPRTDMGLFEDLCQFIGYRPVSFLSTDLQGREIYHTNVMLSVGSDFAVVCLESVENILERTMLKESLLGSGKTVVEISQQQVLQFVGNCLEVLTANQERLLLMSSRAAKSLTEEQRGILEKFVRIVSFDIPVIEQVGGGSVRCMLAGVFVPGSA